MWIPDRDVIHTREVRESREYPCRILILKRIRRLGKLRISNSGRGTVAIDCTNVQRFTITRGSNSPGNINVEGQAMDIENGKVFVRFRKDAEGTWKVRSVLCFRLSFNRSSQITYPEDHVADIQPSGRLSLVLSSKGPLLFVIPDDDDQSLSYALRLAQDLDVFHKLDVEILTDTDANGLLEGGSLGSSNIVIFDGPKKTSLGRRLLGGPKYSPLPTRAYRNGVKSNGIFSVG